ncbi:MAG TPA: hypothetical protein P5079_09835, partial [Elusimicrobiota bacterium]|nr:hypothetical protein [Elusimicrobiota bacterium]
VLGGFLSGDLIARFDDPAVEVEQKGNELVYTASFGELRIDGKTKTISRLLWRDASVSAIPVEFRLSGYQDVEGLLLPFRMDCEISRGTNFSLDFKRLKINFPVDAAQFQLPPAAR